MRRGSALGILVAACATLGAAQPPRITRIEFRPAPEEEGGGVIISLLGSGECTYTMDFGDGNTERRTVTLPDQMRHAYEADNEYRSSPRPRRRVKAPRGPGSTSVRSGAASGKSRSSPDRRPSVPEIAATVEGRGDCAVTLDFGDGRQDRLEGDLPMKRDPPLRKRGRLRAACRSRGALPWRRASADRRQAVSRRRRDLTGTAAARTRQVVPPVDPRVPARALLERGVEAVLLEQVHRRVRRRDQPVVFAGREPEKLQPFFGGRVVERRGILLRPVGGERRRTGGWRRGAGAAAAAATGAGPAGRRSGAAACRASSGKPPISPELKTPT